MLTVARNSLDEYQHYPKKQECLLFPDITAVTRYHVKLLTAIPLPLA